MRPDSARSRVRASADFSAVRSSITVTLAISSSSVSRSVTVIEDLTALKSAEARTQLLAESGRMLVSSLDYGQTLRNVAQVAVPGLADWCAVDLLDDHDCPRRVATAPAPSKLERFRAPDVDSDHGLRHVIRTGTSILYRRVTRDGSFGATSEGHP